MTKAHSEEEWKWSPAGVVHVLCALQDAAVVSAGRQALRLIRTCPNGGRARADRDRHCIGESERTGYAPRTQRDVTHGGPEPPQGGMEIGADPDITGRRDGATTAT
jgi:hypothetical protein